MSKEKSRKMKTNLRKSKTRSVRRYKGGSCGCSKPLFGGYGPSSFQSFDQLPKGSYSVQNIYQDNPSDPSVVESARNLPKLSVSGGRSMKRVRFSNKRKIIKGGSGDLLLGNSSNNVVLTTGNMSGLVDFNNLMTLNKSVDPSPAVQPTLNIYGDHNAPLS
jgi:hypothetical protein